MFDMYDVEGPFVVGEIDLSLYFKSVQTELFPGFLCSSRVFGEVTYW